jgi:hypothetical protein
MHVSPRTTMKTYKQGLKVLRVINYSNRQYAYK